MTPAPSVHAERLRSRSLAGPLLTACALGAAAVYTYVRSPFQSGAFPPCLFHAGTGLYCPGCGGLRAAWSLMHGQFAEAISLNALAVFFMIPAAAVAVVWWAGSAAGRDWPPPRVHPAVFWALGALVLVFSVLRNVGPLAPYLAP